MAKSWSNMSTNNNSLLGLILRIFDMTTGPHLDITTKEVIQLPAPANNPIPSAINSLLVLLTSFFWKRLHLSRNFAHFTRSAREDIALRKCQNKFCHFTRLLYLCINVANNKVHYNKLIFTTKTQKTIIAHTSFLKVFFNYIYSSNKSHYEEDSSEPFRIGLHSIYQLRATKSTNRRRFTNRSHH